MYNCIIRFSQIVFLSNEDLSSYELAGNVRVKSSQGNVRIYV